MRGKIKNNTRTHKKNTSLEVPGLSPLVLMHASIKSKAFQEDRLAGSLLLLITPCTKIKLYRNYTHRRGLFLLFRFLLSGSDSSRCCLWLLVTLSEELPNLWGLQATSWWISGESRAGGKDVKSTLYIACLLKYNPKNPYLLQKGREHEIWCPALWTTIFM